MPEWFALASSAAVVGAILIAINHADALLRGEIDLVRGVKMGVTVLVPYAVSTLSSVRALRNQTQKMYTETISSCESRSD